MKYKNEAFSHEEIENYLQNIIKDFTEEQREFIATWLANEVEEEKRNKENARS